MLRIVASLILACQLVLASGCGGGSGGPVDEPLRLAMEDFGQFLKSIEGDGVKPPRKMQDFIPLEPMAPIAAEYLQNGELVYFWGVGLNESGERIIAHQKGAETNGGWVLLENGKVQSLSAEDFSAASKAGP